MDYKNLYKFFDSWTKWKRVFVLYVKMKCSFLGILKCCMGFLFFLVEIHLVYLYNTYRERLLEKQWLLWNKINAEALIFFHCRWWLVLFAFFYNSQFQLKALLILVNLLIIWQFGKRKASICSLYKDEMLAFGYFKMLYGIIIFLLV